MAGKENLTIMNFYKEHNNEPWQWNDECTHSSIVAHKPTSTYYEYRHFIHVLTAASFHCVSRVSCAWPVGKCLFACGKQILIQTAKHRLGHSLNSTPPCTTLTLHWQLPPSQWAAACWSTHSHGFTEENWMNCSNFPAGSTWQEEPLEPFPWGLNCCRLQKVGSVSKLGECSRLQNDANFIQPSVSDIINPNKSRVSINPTLRSAGTLWVWRAHLRVSCCVCFAGKCSFSSDASSC